MACAALAFAGVLALQPANNDAIRGFDPASQAAEIKWEQQARAIPEAARVGAFIEKLSNRPHLAGTPQSKETAEYILAQLKEYGLDAQIEQYEAPVADSRRPGLLGDDRALFVPGEARGVRHSR